MRGLDVLRAVTSGIDTTLVVGEDDDYIWLTCICMNKGCEEESGNEKWITRFHGMKL